MTDTRQPGSKTTCWMLYGPAGFPLVWSAERTADRCIATTVRTAIYHRWCQRTWEQLQANGYSVRLVTIVPVVPDDATNERKRKEMSAEDRKQTSTQGRSDYRKAQREAFRDDLAATTLWPGYHPVAYEWHWRGWEAGYMLAAKRLREEARKKCTAAALLYERGEYRELADVLDQQVGTLLNTADLLEKEAK